MSSQPDTKDRVYRIAVFPHKQLLYVRCNDLPITEHLVEGTGLITIRKDCQIKTDQILIQAQNGYQSEIYKEVKPLIVDQWDFNETIRQIQYISSDFIKKSESPNVISYGESNKLKHFSTNIMDIQKKFNDSKFLNYNSRYQLPTNSSADYWFFTLFILVLMSSYAILLIGYEHFKGSNGFYRPREEEKKGRRTRDPQMIEENIIMNETLNTIV